MKLRSLLPLAACLLAPCMLWTSAVAGNRPLARVDGQALFGEDLEQSFASRHSGHVAFLAGETEVRQALSLLIDRTLLIQEAERLELDRLPSIEAELEALADRLTVGHLVEVEIRRPAEPGEEAIRAAWERFTDHLLKVRRIVVAGRDEALEIEARLEQGEPFDELARERSRDRSGQAGGLMPPVGWGSMEASWDDAVFELEPGATSKPFPSGGAWEIVRVEERIEIEPSDYAKAHDRIEGILLRRGLEQRERELSDRLHATYEVVVELSPSDAETYRAALDCDPQTVVATWKGGELRIGELAELADFGSLAQLSEEQAAAGIETLVRKTVTARLMGLEARGQGYRELPEIRTRLESQREAAVLAVLHEEYIFRDVTVGDAEIREWYDANQEELRLPERRMVAQILVATEDEAGAAKARLDEGAPFPELAAEISIDASSAAKGGILGWIGEEDSPPGFEQVFALAEMEVSEPLESDLGWHLIRVLGIEPARVPELEEVEPKIRDHLTKTKQQEARGAWLVQLREEAKIKINSKAVRAFAADHAPEGPPPSH